MRRFAQASAAVAALLALAACQNPTGVGVGLLDEDAANPALRTVTATTTDTTEATLITAGFASAQSAQPQRRVLTGRVQDARFGDAVATAYIDAVQPSNLPDGFEGATATSVTLELLRDYAYGDTTSVLPIEIRRQLGNWGPEGLPGDTVLATGDLITTVDVDLSAADSLVTITLPADFLAANPTLFTGSDFGTAFEGFALSVADMGNPMPGAIVGFDMFSSRSRLRVATAQDTVTYPLAEVYTLLTQSAPTMPPADIVPYRSGAPTALAIGLDLSSVGTVPLARAVLSLPLDRSVAREGSFVRPIPAAVGVFGVSASGTRTFLSDLSTTVAGDPRTVSSAAITLATQSLLLGQPSFDHLEIVFRPSPLSLDVFPVGRVGTDRAPRLLLTVVTPA